MGTEESGMVVVVLEVVFEAVLLFDKEAVVGGVGFDCKD